MEPEYKAKLADSEKTISMLSDKRYFTWFSIISMTKSLTRDCLLRELKAIKKVLISSLNTINHLEVEVAKVPELETRIVQVESR